MTNPMTIPTLAFQQLMTLMTMMTVQRGTPLLATHTTSIAPPRRTRCGQHRITTHNKHDRPAAA